VYYYNRVKAIRYALTYCMRCNPDFHYYWERGDCTNFVSQALWAGGWPMVIAGTFGDDSWAAEPHPHASDEISGWHFKHSASPAWAAAEPFQRFILHSGRAWISNRFQMQIGDVVQICEIDGTPAGDAPEHTMMITKWEPPGSGTAVGGVRMWLSYHSKDRMNVPIEEIERGLTNKQQFVFYKTADVVPQVPAGSHLYTPD
jgi:hypothetical protein